MCTVNEAKLRYLLIYFYKDIHVMLYKLTYIGDYIYYVFYFYLYPDENVATVLGVSNCKNVPFIYLRYDLVATSIKSEACFIDQ